jgi:AcrR family transcriptional regulator
MEKKEAILQAAKTLFSEKGYKATNISEITETAGIATGTFYLYYDSKTQLFMDLFLDENLKLKKHLMEIIDLNGDPESVIQELTLLNMEGMRSNPILREWYNREVFEKIEEKYREDKGIDNLDFLYSIFITVIKRWQAEGKMRSDIDSEMIMAIFSAVINIDTHKDEIGIEYFPEILDYLMDFVMKGLLTGSGGGDKQG